MLWSTVDVSTEMRVVEVVDARGHSRTMMFDYLGRVLKITFPDSNCVAVSYNDLQNTVTHEFWNFSVSSNALPSDDRRLFKSESRHLL